MFEGEGFRFLNRGALVVRIGLLDIVYDIHKKEPQHSIVIILGPICLPEARKAALSRLSLEGDGLK